MLTFLFILGIAGSLMTLAAGRRAALACHFVDKPGGRKQHDEGVPPIGGLVIIPAFFILHLFMAPETKDVWPLFISVLILLVTGAVDDRYTLNPWIKFAVQIIAAAFIVYVGGAQIGTLGALIGKDEIEMGAYAGPFTILCLVVLMNALNMMDGIDGLAGGVTLVILLGLAAVCAQAGLWGEVAGIAALIAPLLAFLVFNMRHPWREKASVFMGDSGSLTLALVLGWLLIDLSQGVHRALLPVTAIWFVAVPVIDAMTIFFLRLIKRKHPFSPDRNHLHHRFLNRGFSVRATVYLSMLAAFITTGIGTGGMYAGVPEYALFALWLGILALYTAFSLRPSAEREFF